MPGIINTIILIPTLLIAAYFDLKTKKIPNILTFPVILLGLLSSTIVSGFKGLQFSILGFLLGMAVFFIPFALNMMGAGDVKLMGAIGALMGWKFTLSAVIYSSIAGAVISIIMLVMSKRLGNILLTILGVVLQPVFKFIYVQTGSAEFYNKYQFFDRNNSSYKKQYIPYGVAIGIGSLLVLANIVPRII